MKYIQQITDYYEAQGLVGNALKESVDDDVERVLEYVRLQDLDPQSFIFADDDLSVLFTWSETEEGHDYWSDRCVEAPSSP